MAESADKVDLEVSERKPNLTNQQSSQANWLRTYFLQQMGDQLKAYLISQVDHAVKQFASAHDPRYQCADTSPTVKIDGKHTVMNREGVPNLTDFAAIVMEDIGDPQEVVYQARALSNMYSSVQDWRDANKLRHEYLVRLGRRTGDYDTKTCYFCNVSFSKKSNNGPAIHAKCTHVVDSKKYPCRIEGCTKWFAAVWMEEAHQITHSRRSKPSTAITSESDSQDEVHPPPKKRIKTAMGQVNRPQTNLS